MRRAIKVAIVICALGLFIVAFFYAPLIPMNIVPCVPNGSGNGYASMSYYLFTQGATFLKGGEIFLGGHWAWLDFNNAHCN
jgi:hypothetical protein